MNRDEYIGLFLMLAFVAAIFMFGLSVGLHWDSGDAVRKSAIEAGVARWTVDAKTGKTGFEWVKD